METAPRKYQKHKTEVKITVKHFLNTGLKPDVDKRTGLLLYRIYVRVSVNRQLTQFRSRLRYLIPIGDLEELLSSEPVKIYADYERFIIEQTVREMKPEQKAHFKLTKWSEYYKAGLISLSESVSDFIVRQIYAILEDNYHWTEQELRQLNSLTIPETFSFLSKINILEITDLKKRYSVLLETGIYERQILNYSSYEVCLWDGLYSTFQDQLSQLGQSIALDYVITLNEVLPQIKIS